MPITKQEVLDNDLVGETYSDEFTDDRVIADEDGLHYLKSWSGDQPLLKYGTCSDCGTDLVSWAKHVICPECGNNAYVT